MIHEHGHNMPVFMYHVIVIWNDPHIILLCEDHSRLQLHVKSYLQRCDSLVREGLKARRFLLARGSPYSYITFVFLKSGRV